MYFEIYARTLLELGCVVYALCPDPAAIRNRLSPLSPEHASRFHTSQLLGWAEPPKGTPRPLRSAIAGARTFWQIRKQLSRLVSDHRHEIDLVFFACIYDRHFYEFPLFGRLLPWRWTGLYLHSFGFRSTTSPIYSEFRKWAQPERFLNSDRMVAIATLDEGIVGKVQAVTARSNCIVFPDFTNETRPTDATGLGEKIRRFASGRPVITLCGALYRQRGLEAFLTTALENPGWCFALVGEFTDDIRTDPIAGLLSRFLEDHPYSFVHPLRVVEDVTYNSVILASDVLWNIHLDWPGSSNTLTKAAIFEKPVIVGEGHLLAERVKRWRLGEVCTDSDVAGISAALHRILDNPNAWRDQHNPAWKDYRAEHSIRRLRNAFTELLGHLPAGGGRESTSR